MKTIVFRDIQQDFIETFVIALLYLVWFCQDFPVSPWFYVFAFSRCDFHFARGAKPIQVIYLI